MPPGLETGLWKWAHPAKVKGLKLDLDHKQLSDCLKQANLLRVLTAHKSLGK